MRYKPLQKVLKLLVVAGLPTILLLVIVLIQKKRRFGVWNQMVILLSPYRRLRKYIIAQASFETADPEPLQSYVYRTDNNMFGMKGATRRKQLGTPGTTASDGGRYQHYRTDTQSIRDLFLYFEAQKFPTTVTDVRQYSQELKTRGYYTADYELYTNGLKRFL